MEQGIKTNEGRNHDALEREMMTEGLEGKRKNMHYERKFVL